MLDCSATVLVGYFPVMFISTSWGLRLFFLAWDLLPLTWYIHQPSDMDTLLMTIRVESLMKLTVLLGQVQALWCVSGDIWKLSSLISQHTGLPTPQNFSTPNVSQPP